MCYSRRQITCEGATKGNTKMSILEPVQCGRSLHLGLSNPPNEINFLTGNHQSLTAKCRSRTPYFKCTRTHTHIYISHNHMLGQLPSKSLRRFGSSLQLQNMAFNVYATHMDVELWFSHGEGFLVEFDFPRISENGFGVHAVHSLWI